MAGNGKIARLPWSIRNELNHRLRDGEAAKQLVNWLNGSPEVQDVLREQFGARPISEQNLSEWKQRGHQEWLKREEKRALLRDILDEAEELEDEAGETPLTDRLTRWRLPLPSYYGSNWNRERRAPNNAPPFWKSRASSPGCAKGIIIWNGCVCKVTAGTLKSSG